MKKTLLFIILFFAIFTSAFCASEKNAIEKVVEEYQNAVNSYDKDKLKALFAEPDSYDVQLFLLYLIGMHEQGLNFHYKIDVIETKINGSIAEVRLKTVAKLLSGEDNSVDLMPLFGSSLIDSIMTLRKIDGSWKIVAEKVLE